MCSKNSKLKELSASSVSKLSMAAVEFVLHAQAVLTKCFSSVIVFHKSLNRQFLHMTISSIMLCPHLETKFHDI